MNWEWLSDGWHGIERPYRGAVCQVFDGRWSCWKGVRRVRSVRDDFVKIFYLTRLNADVPLHAQQLLAYKIQSPLEKEAVRGLDLLEICVRSSGKLFHNEIGKYRFLNELIRVVSPKYLGPRYFLPILNIWLTKIPRSSSQVKKRIIEFMYGWTIALKGKSLWES